MVRTRLRRATATMISPSRSPDALAAARPEVAGYRTLPFASCYVYVPRGEGLLSEAGHLICQRVKASDPLWLPRYAGQVVELCARERPFRELFARDAWLVPAPGCTPAPVESAVRRIVLVDDVITKGRTLLAAAAKLRGQFPHADIRAFAMVRTMGFLHHAERLLEPCEGFVHWGNGDARREP
jgi:hypothetical protein